MRDLLRLFTPPEWGSWNWAGRLAFVVVFAGIMIPVIAFANWLGEAIFG